MPQAEQLTIKQTRTGYWTVQRGSVQLSGATTREGAEAERDLLRRLSGRIDHRRRSAQTRRLHPRYPAR